MDTEEKKPKRPRIGQARPTINNTDGEQTQHRFERVGYTPRPRYNNNSDSHSTNESQQGYTPRYQQQQQYGRPYYHNNYQNNRQNSYNNNDTPYAQTDSPASYENGENGEQQQPTQYRQYNRDGQQQRPYRQYNNQGGYRQNNNRGGYRQNNNQGGYRQNNNQGGYRQNNNQGGYRQNNNNQGGYRPNNNRGGYRPNNNQATGGYRPGNQQPRPGKSFVPRPKRIEYEMPIPDPNEQIRLNKFMANAGICSRREADEYIQQGLVTVNGTVTTELGTKITHSDVVEYDGKIVALESKCYILLNKPKDCVTTCDDPNGRMTVMDLVKGACTERIYPVGRLDRNTTGVLLLTNDGDLASKLTHPQYVKKKIYHVWCDKDIAEEDMQRIADGIELEDGPIHADEISYATETDRNQAGIEIHSGRNRIVRRIFESLGYHVTKLDRVYFAGLTKKNLPRGRWRYLTQDEVNFLKMGSFE